MKPLPSGILRLLDAALNRAREAARSAEDYARFVADRPAEARALKALRIELGHLGRAVPPVARDVDGDPMREHTPSGEARRDSAQAVATSSLKRLEEALRSLEEHGKLLNPAFSAAAKRLRYEAYRIEAALWEWNAPASTALRLARLYAVLSPALMPGDPFKSARQALAGGVQVLQLRAKDTGWGDRALLPLARRLSSLCRNHNVPFLLNDRADLALAAGADGVHLGQSDLAVPEARRLFGRRLLIGVSTHSRPQILEACRADISYLAVGPVFPTLTKPHRRPVGLGLLKSIPEGAPPVFTIGGIETANLPRVLRAGATRVAVTGAVFRAPDIRAAARRLRRALDTPPERG